MEDNWSIKDHGHLAPEDISRDDYFMDMARVVWEKCTCNRWKCGCVIVKDNAMISSWFANAPEWSPTCDEAGHLMLKFLKDNGEEETHCMRNSCAEQMAVANAAKRWISLEGATLYVTMTPCTIRHCAHMIVACGIKRVVCDKRGHHAAESEEILKKWWVEFTYLNEEVIDYPTK